MARSVNTIYSAFERAVIAAGAAVGLTINPSNWSKQDYKRLMLSINADSQGIQEQLYDSFVSDTEKIARTAPSMTDVWIQYQMLNVFEYDAIAVPIVQLDISGSNPSFAPFYTNPNANFRIVKYCSVVRGTLGTTIVKIAGAGPTKINPIPLSAAQTFVNTINGPGIYYNVVSFDSDKLFMQLDVYYSGLYSAVINNTVKAAIQDYLSTIPFNGKITLSDLLLKIKSVPGVIDCVFVNVKSRQDTVAVGSGIDLVVNKTEVNKDCDTFAGYIVLENTAGGNWMLDDYRIGSSGDKNLNLIPQ